jgi:hypothetical protein
MTILYVIFGAVAIYAFLFLVRAMWIVILSDFYYQKFSHLIRINLEEALEWIGGFVAVVCTTAVVYHTGKLIVDWIIHL